MLLYEITNDLSIQFQSAWCSRSNFSAGHEN